jgi:hypothetical protein
MALNDIPLFGFGKSVAMTRKKQPLKENNHES